MNDLVSIVIPAYNASNYLSEAIESALSQTYSNIEIIVVNDGSPDNGETRKIAMRYGEKIRYYEKENGGCASALNYGISQMNGRWFSWLSHDDLYEPRKIEELLGLIERYKLDPDSTVLGCNDFIMGPDRIKKASLFNNSIGNLSPEIAFGETLNKKTFNGCGLLIPKSILNDVGNFRTDYKHLLDRELWMRIAVHGYSYCYADCPLVVSRVHGQQVTVKAQKVLYGEETKLIEEYIGIIENKSLPSEFMKQLCFFAYKRKHYEQGKKMMRIMSEKNNLDRKTRLTVLKYSIYGVGRSIVGPVYKNLIRK